MRLIDADALKKQFEDRSLEDFTHLHFIDAIDNAPTVEYTFEEVFQKTVCEQRLYCPERPTGEWIPVSESLPEECQRVLVTIVNYREDKVVRVSEYYNREGKGVFRIKENNEQWEVGEKGLLAWMPLPEAYKETENDR